MNYFKNTNNQIFAYDDSQVAKGYGTGLEEILTPVKEDGTVYAGHKNLSTLQTKEDGTYYDFYNADGTPNLVEQAKVDKESLIASFKSAYLAEVDKVLKVKDYDSLATVKLWADDANYGTEATSMLDWYKAVITKNYEILNEVEQGIRTVPTVEEYKLELPNYGI